MKSSHRNNVLAGCLFLAASLLPQAAFAQTITEDTPLSFGEIVVISYATVGRVTINPSGTYSYNANIYLHTPPQIGEYSVSGAPPSTPYTIMLPSSLAITGPGGPFTLDNLESRPLAPVTDASGNGTFTISGRLQTLGGGAYYGDGTYTIHFPVTINF